MTKKTINLFLLILLTVIYLQCGGNHDHQQIDNNNKSTQLSKQSVGRRHQRQRVRGKQLQIKKSSAPNTITLSQESKDQINIKTITVRKNEIRSVFSAMGKVKAQKDKKAIVGYACPARISQINVSVGDWVKQGQPLCLLECSEVGNAKSEFFKAITEYELAKMAHEREKRLFSKNVGAKKDYESTQAAFSIAQANFQAAEKRLVVLGFSKQKIDNIIKEKDVSPYISVHSPISGRLAQNNAVIGAMIEPATQVMLIINPDSLWVDAEIYEKDIAKILMNQPVKITVPAYPKEIFTGNIHYIGDMVNPETRTITVRTKVSNKEFKMKPGMFADIQIVTDQNRKSITLPLSAVLDDGSDKIVFVQTNGQFVRKKVKTGSKYNGFIEIVSGLTVGELVVVEGNYQLQSKLKAAALSHTH